MNRNKGFTLIEVIIVLVIVGILSSLALSNLFQWINKSKAAEALLSLKSYKDMIVACGLSKGYSNCYGSPLESTENFNYYYGQCSANGDFGVIAQPKGTVNVNNSFVTTRCKGDRVISMTNIPEIRICHYSDESIEILANDLYKGIS